LPSLCEEESPSKEGGDSHLTTFCLREYTTAKRHLQRPLHAIFQEVLLKSTIIVNITWNPSGWREIYINPKAGHRYAKEHPGHETLNFKFDKKKLDTEKRIYGYVQWTHPPKDFTNSGIVLFYSKNLELNKSQIVGIYCDTKIYPTAIKTNYKGLKNDELLSNLEASKNISMLFPIFLNANNYSDKRLVPQIGFTYKDKKFAEQIIKDEINELKKSNIKLEDF
jgi:hypothetical protein